MVQAGLVKSAQFEALAQLVLQTADVDIAHDWLTLLPSIEGVVAKRETLPYRTDDVRGLRRAVARDLETLLNTRHEALEEIPESLEEVRRSLLVYGLPDFTLADRDGFGVRFASR